MSASSRVVPTRSVVAPAPTPQTRNSGATRSFVVALAKRCSTSEDFHDCDVGAVHTARQAQTTVTVCVWPAPVVEVSVIESFCASFAKSSAVSVTSWSCDAAPWML